MPTIKNTAELRRRARWHAANDTVQQGTYSEGSSNGEVEFIGCAIGCLATPHTKRGLRDWIRAQGEKVLGEYTLSESDDHLTRRLRDEFGIDPSLARLAELVFEYLPDHQDAIRFIPAFVEALPEGAEIKRRDVAEFQRSLPVGPDDRGAFGHETRVGTLSTGADQAGYRWRQSGAYELQAKVLAWLRRMAA